MREDCYRCPDCGSAVVWNLTNCRAGAETTTNCVKYPTQSRMDFRPTEDWFCVWTGIARRDENRNVKLYHADGVTLLRKRYN